MKAFTPSGGFYASSSELAINAYTIIYYILKMVDVSSRIEYD